MDLLLAPDPVAIPLESGATATVSTPSFTDPEVLQHIKPHRASVVRLDEYRTRMGWPVEIPRVDSRSLTLATAEGYVISQRPEPDEVGTGAAARWIAGADTYDQVRGSWKPTQGPETGFRWVTAPDFAPELVEGLSYMVGKEVFRRDGINFDASSRQHMWSQFQGALVGTTGYTVIMAVRLTSRLGNTEGRQFMGIWAPGQAYSADEAERYKGFSVLLEGSQIVVDSEEGENHKGLVATSLLASSQVVYLAFSLQHPVSTVWGSLGPGKTTRTDTMVGHDVHSQQMDVLLGRSLGSLENTADMMVMDLGIYYDVLTSEQVEREISILAKSYGG